MRLRLRQRPTPNSVHAFAPAAQTLTAKAWRSRSATEDRDCACAVRRHARKVLMCLSKATAGSIAACLQNAETQTESTKRHPSETTQDLREVMEGCSRNL